METIRERLEREELTRLGPFASKNLYSKGRKKPAEKCPVRTEFQKDRDRITHSKAFRRLMHKTQVFISPEGDHYRTRLTHTIEVSQIARTFSRALRLNEDLTEAIALGHDLGHTPFGHTGEDALNNLMSGGFRHNEQSVRVVEVLENNGEGLNLTYEVTDGIYNHRTSGNPATLEGRVVMLSDKIAYMNHDIDDALRSGLLRQDEIPPDIIKTLGETSRGRIDFLVKNAVEESEGKDGVSLAPDVWEIMMALRKFLFERVYENQIRNAEEKKIQSMLGLLFEYYMKNTRELPLSGETAGPERAACDDIAGMTDRFALKRFAELFIPNVWEE
jgi:dGTPase